MPPEGTLHGDILRADTVSQLADGAVAQGDHPAEAVFVAVHIEQGTAVARIGQDVRQRHVRHDARAGHGDQPRERHPARLTFQVGADQGRIGFDDHKRIAHRLGHFPLRHLALRVRHAPQAAASQAEQGTKNEK